MKYQLEVTKLEARIAPGLIVGGQGTNFFGPGGGG